MKRNKRPNNILRKVNIIPDQFEYADGSVLIEMGKTKILIAATVENRVPPFLKGKGTGWITAEYAMLPRATNKRTVRDRSPNKISGRTQEIQRLIGRSLRAVVSLKDLGERTIIIDCDVLQADGGTRCASITGSSVALALALKKLMDDNTLDRMPLKNLAGAVSVGIVDGIPMLDLNYQEDSNADTDMNVVETDAGEIIELQASAEKKPFSKKEFESLLALADKGIRELIIVQKEILKKKSMLFMAYNA